MVNRDIGTTDIGNQTAAPPNQNPHTINDAPVATDDHAQTNYETTVSGSVPPNDADPDGDQLTVTLIESPTNGTAMVNSSGDYTYTPNSGFQVTTHFPIR